MLSYAKYYPVFANVETRLHRLFRLLTRFVDGCFHLFKKTDDRRGKGRDLTIKSFCLLNMTALLFFNDLLDQFMQLVVRFFDCTHFRNITILLQTVTVVPFTKHAIVMGYRFFMGEGGHAVKKTSKPGFPSQMGGFCGTEIKPAIS